ncbi:putative inorganic phosphate cotransporter like protein [Argiope bruennichi]|uniref:Putative inorganic phosphate cotransporter like protein n=1 Tax=Argiope bruennichi TaxID=94029 RepID=A0A8T0G230_ARGBR|nr:putative inorganic phosphate cotransporter like protein [Argiope bruennichi]
MTGTISDKTGTLSNVMTGTISDKTVSVFSSPGVHVLLKIIIELGVGRKLVTYRTGKQESYHREFNFNSSIMPPAYGTCEPIDNTNLRDLSRSSFSIDQSTPLVVRRRVTTYVIPKRYIFSVLCFTACCIAVSYNINLSIAIVSMVKHDKKFVTEPTQLVTLQGQTEKVTWDANIESVALGAVYYGQLISFIPGGRMAELYGGKRMIIICTLISSLATLLLPITAVWSPYTFIIMRILVGVGTGPIIPIVFYMLSRWIPEHERGFHASFILSGYGIGSFLAVIVSGAMCGTTFLGGWPSNGVLSCLPHLLRAFATCLASYPIDLLLKRQVVSVEFVRKGATVINTVVSCGAFIGITYVGRDVTATTILFILGGVLGEFVTFGVCLAGVDIAPNLSGTVSGILNIVGVFPFFIIPALVGWMTHFQNTIEEWQKVFYTTVAIVSISTFIFVIFGDLKPQSWGVARRENTKSREERPENPDRDTEPKAVENLA